jgi:hypothetical protein
MVQMSLQRLKPHSRLLRLPITLTHQLLRTMVVVEVSILPWYRSLGFKQGLTRLGLETATVSPTLQDKS